MNVLHATLKIICKNLTMWAYSTFFLNTSLQDVIWLLWYLILIKYQFFQRFSKTQNKFYIDDIDPLEIGHATVTFIELLHSSTLNLSRVRRQIYYNLVVSSRSKIQLAMLPSCLRTAFHHGLRVFHQVLVWRRLSAEDIPPLNWGWKYWQRNQLWRNYCKECNGISCSFKSD